MFTCIIVDDEAPARQLLQMYIRQVPDLTVQNVFSNAMSAFTFLQNNKVDLMFLDIKMPQMTGLNLLKSLLSAPKTIMTTAFREYASDGFDLDVVDYLVKPISQERFLRAISKFHDFATIQSINQKQDPIDEHPYAFFKVGKDQKKIFLKDILYIEGLKDYIKVHTVATTLVAYGRIGYLEEKLPEGQFIRVHKSFIVSIPRISKYNSEALYINDFAIPIGRVYKSRFDSLVKQIRF